MNDKRILFGSFIVSVGVTMLVFDFWFNNKQNYMMLSSNSSSKLSYLS